MAFSEIVDGGISEGFDLDGVVTETGDEDVGCGVADLVSPSGLEGVDNAFARLLPVLETTEFVAADGLIAASITSGELLLIGEISGLDDPTEDDCVTMAIHRAEGQPMLTTDGQIMAGQTLLLDPAFPAQTYPEVPLVAGTVEGRPLDVSLPLQILNAALEFRLLNGALRYSIQEDGTVIGAFAGGLEVGYLISLLDTEGVADELVELALPLLGAMADLAPDDQGTCSQLSITFTFEAVPVYVLNAP